MSGQKDLTVHAVDQRLIEARRLAQQRIEEQRRQAESSIASIRSELAVTSRKAAEANQQLEQLQARQQRIQSQLSQLSDERRRLSAQLRAMNRETLQARDEASALSAKVEQDYRDTENQIGRLAQLERQLIDEENDLERNDDERS